MVKIFMITESGGLVMAKGVVVTRLFSVFTAIQGGRPYTAGELASKMGVSARTIFRDLGSLQTAGYPIYYDPDKKTYRITANFQVRPLHIDERVVRALERALCDSGRVQSGRLPDRPVGDHGGAGDPRAAALSPQRGAAGAGDHPSQETVKQLDGSVLVSMITRGPTELSRWLVGYGGSVEVLEPQTLRAAVLALAQGVLESHPAR